MDFENMQEGMGWECWLQTRRHQIKINVFTTGTPTDHRNSCFTVAPHIPSKGCPWDRLILVAGGKSDVYLIEIINESISEHYYKEQWNILELIRLLVAITFSIQLKLHCQVFHITECTNQESHFPKELDFFCAMDNDWNESCSTKSVCLIDRRKSCFLNCLRW